MLKGSFIFSNALTDLIEWISTG